MARIAAVVLASIGAFGLLATAEPFRSPTADVAVMRPIAAAAIAIAVVLSIAAPRRLPTVVFHALLVGMSASIAALAYAGHTQQGDLTMLFLFVVVFATYFLPPRVSALYAAALAAFLAGRLAFGDSRAIDPEELQIVILIPSLASAWALVALLQTQLADREARLLQHDVYDPETGLLSPNGLTKTLEAELARAARHGRPLSLVLLEITGSAVEAGEPGHRLVPAVSRAIVTRIRAEDKAARLAELRFAVVAIETRGDGAAALGTSLADQVRKRIVGLGFEMKSFTVRVGWADNLLEDMSRVRMVAEAEGSLESAIASADGIALPRESRAPPPLPEPVPQPDGVNVAAG